MSDTNFDPGSAMQYMAPSGVQVDTQSTQILDPVSASTGAPANVAGSVLSYSDKNSPPGPPIYKLNKYDIMWQAYWGTAGFYDTQFIQLRRLFELPINFYNNSWWGGAENASIIPV